MFRPIVCSILLVTLVAGAAVPEPPQNDIKVSLVVVNDASQLDELKQGAELIPIEAVQTRGQIRYTLGNRVPNDRLVSQSSNYYQWSTPQDVQLKLQYPASGTGAIVKFVEIVVSQSSDIGRAYVVSGGIGQRSIVIVVEAYNTLWFNYVAKIYGV